MNRKYVFSIGGLIGMTRSALHAGGSHAKTLSLRTVDAFIVEDASPARR